MAREGVLQSAKAYINEGIKVGGLSVRADPIIQLEHYLEQDAQDAEAIALLGYGYLFAGSGYGSKADELFEKALSIDKNCALALFGKGYRAYWGYFYRRESIDQGIEALDRAIEIDPTLIEAYAWKANMLYDILKQPKQAYEVLRSALSILKQKPKCQKSAWSWLVFLKLGQYCIEHDLGELQETFDYLEKSLKLNPDNDSAAMWLMLLYKELGKYGDEVRCRAAYRRANLGTGLDIAPEAFRQVSEFVSKYK